MDKTGTYARRLWLWVYALAAAVLGLVCFFALREPPRPEVQTVAVSRTAAIPAMETQTAAEPGKTRREGVYTLLLAGLDDGNGNTDTIMLARLDSNARRLDVVSIPRDTMVNTRWNVRKLNAAYTVGVLSGEDGGESLRRHVAKLSGIEADYCAIVRLGVFERAVDLLGGVDFDVPMAMDYEDLEQGLRIHLQPGMQHLSGAQALGLCRFRSGYPSADLGRIEMQQRFLRECAAQFIRLGNIPNLPKLVSLLSENLETDLSAGTIGWFLRQLLRCPSENIHFTTAPCAADTVRGISYTVLELEPWLELVNESLNPYTQPITTAELDLIYLQDGVLGCTGEPRFTIAETPEEAVPAMAAETVPETPRIVVVELPGK